MWPFRRHQSSQKPKPRRPSSPDPAAELFNHPIEAGTARVSQNAITTQKFLDHLGVIDRGLFRELSRDISAFQKRLDAFTTDLAMTGSLDRFSGSTAAAYDRLKNTVGRSADVVARKFKLGSDQQIPAVMAYINGVVDPQQVDQYTLMLAQQYQQASQLTQNIQSAYETVMESVLAAGNASTETSWDKMLVKMMSGWTLVFIEGCPTVIVLDTSKLPARSISTPSVERSVLGPQDAFNEVINTQMALVRSHLKTPDLRFDQLLMGTLSQTTVVVAHVEGLTNPDIVAAVKRKLWAVQLDTVLESDQLVPALSSRPTSLFPQVRRTERPAVVARELAMGKVAVLTDHSPFALLVPNTMLDFYQTLGDYAQSFWATSLERIVRLLGLGLGLLLPPLYIALVGVNPELLPTTLTTTIAGTREGLPFPPIFEVLTMWIIIEVLREAALRLPKELSTTIGTVGAIVVGTAVVRAGIVSPLMIVVITLTALGLFTSPSYDMATPWRVLFWLLVILAWIFGMFGIIMGLLLILSHLARIESFGIAYLSPFAPHRSADLKDSIVKFPKWRLRKRPTFLYPLQVSKGSHWKQDPMPHPQPQETQEERWHDDE